MLNCPRCGDTAVLVAKDGKATRRCSNCGHTWLPQDDAKETPDLSATPVDLGPELFGTEGLMVLNYRGENYYLACGEFVSGTPDGGSSFCILPKFQKHYEHKDSKKNVRDEGVSYLTADSALRVQAEKTLSRTGLTQEQIFNALNALQSKGFTIQRGT